MSHFFSDLPLLVSLMTSYSGADYSWGLGFLTNLFSCCLSNSPGKFERGIHTPSPLLFLHQLEMGTAVNSVRVSPAVLIRHTTVVMPCPPLGIIRSHCRKALLSQPGATGTLLNHRLNTQFLIMRGFVLLLGTFQCWDISMPASQPASRASTLDKSQISLNTTYFLRMASSED